MKRQETVGSFKSGGQPHVEGCKKLTEEELDKVSVSSKVDNNHNEKKTKRKPAPLKFFNAAESNSSPEVSFKNNAYLPVHYRRGLTILSPTTAGPCNMGDMNLANVRSRQHRMSYHHHTPKMLVPAHVNPNSIFFSE